MQGAEADAAAAEVCDDSDEVLEGAGEPVEAGDDEGVAGPEVVQQVASSGRSAVLPDGLSANTRMPPASVRARVCRSRICPTVDTRA